MDQLAITNNVCLYGHVLRRTLELEVESQSKKGRPKKTWKKQVEEESVGQRRERSKWSVGINLIAAGLR